MKRLLILLIGAYVIGGWLLPLVGLTVLVPFQFLIAAILIGWAFKVLKVLGWCLLLYVVGQFLWMWLMPGLLPVFTAADAKCDNRDVCVDKALSLWYNEYIAVRRRSPCRRRAKLCPEPRTLRGGLPI